MVLHLFLIKWTFEFVTNYVYYQFTVTRSIELNLHFSYIYSNTSCCLADFQYNVYFGSFILCSVSVWKFPFSIYRCQNWINHLYPGFAFFEIILVSFTGLLQLRFNVCCHQVLFWASFHWFPMNLIECVIPVILRYIEQQT